jgi:hypothetical protein
LRYDRQGPLEWIEQLQVAFIGLGNLYGCVQDRLEQRNDISVLNIVRAYLMQELHRLQVGGKSCFCLLALHPVADEPFQKQGIGLLFRQVQSSSGLHGFDIDLQATPSCIKDQWSWISQRCHLPDQLDPAPVAQVVIDEHGLVLVVQHFLPAGMVRVSPIQNDLPPA